MSVLIISIIFIGVAVLLLSIKLILKDKGEFPSTHVGGNKAMQERDISCHTSQHREQNNELNLADRLKAREQNNKYQLK